jgi:hypothetical protein
MSKQKIWNTEAGLSKLDKHLTEPTNRTVFDRLVSALHKNIREEHLYGSIPTIRDERVTVVRHLNEISLDTLDVSFNSLCLIETDRDAQGIPYETRLNQWQDLIPLGNRTTLLDFLTLEYQLWVNITHEFLYSNTEAIQRERAHLLKLLNEIVRTYTNQQYSTSSQEKNPFSSTITSYSTSHSIVDTHTSWGGAAGGLISQFNYEAGINGLEAHLTDFEGRVRCSRLAEALRNNLREEIAHGTTEDIRNERFRLIHALNVLALELTGRSFNDWCLSSDNPAM